MDDHLTVARDGGVPRLDDIEAEAGGDGGVHCVSAALEDVDSDLGGDRVRSRDGAVLDDDLVLVRPPDAACVQFFCSRHGMGVYRKEIDIVLNILQMLPLLPVKTQATS